MKSKSLASDPNQEALSALRNHVAFDNCMSFDARSMDERCDAAAIGFVTHHLIVKPVQNLP
jgi:hypothetical protein